MSCCPGCSKVLGEFVMVDTVEPDAVTGHTRSSRKPRTCLWPADRAAADGDFGDSITEDVLCAAFPVPFLPGWDPGPAGWDPGPAGWDPGPAPANSLLHRHCPWFHWCPWLRIQWPGWGVCCHGQKIVSIENSSLSSDDVFEISGTGISASGDAPGSICDCEHCIGYSSDEDSSDPSEISVSRADIGGWKGPWSLACLSWSCRWEWVRMGVPGGVLSTFLGGVPSAF